MAFTSSITQLIIDVLVIVISVSLLIVSIIFTPAKTGSNIFFKITTTVLALTSLCSIFHDALSIEGTNYCDNYYKEHKIMSDPSVVLCTQNLTAIFSAISFNMLIVFTAFVSILKIRFLEQFNYNQFAFLTSLLLLLFSTLLYLSLSIIVVVYERLAFYLEIACSVSALLFPATLVYIEYKILQQKRRQFICQEPNHYNQLTECCYNLGFKGVQFDSGKIELSKKKKQSLLNVEKFSKFYYFPIISAVFLLLTFIFFIHAKFGFGNAVTIAEYLLLQINYLLFTVFVVFLLTAQPAQQKSHSVCEILNDKFEIQQFKLFMHEKGSIGYYFLYQKLLQLKVLEAAEDQSLNGIKSEIDEVLQHLNIEQKSYEDLERLARCELEGSYIIYSSENCQTETFTQSEKSLFEMILQQIRKTNKRESIGQEFICGEYD